MTPGIDDLPGVFMLGVQGVGGDDRVCEIQVGQQGPEYRDFVARG
nr:hypothetical protein [Nonomuraea deserti]